MSDLSDRRRDLGLTQSELARAAGISRTALSLIENGRLRPSPRTMGALERGLDPLANPVFLRLGQGALVAPDTIRAVGEEHHPDKPLTPDAGLRCHTRDEAPRQPGANVRPLEGW